MNRFKTIMAVAVLTVISFAVFAQTGRKALYSATEDKAVALRIRNEYSSEVVTLTIAAGDSAANYCLVQTPGGTLASNALDFSGAGADTMTEIAALIAACTNASGVKSITVDYDCSLAADSTDDELLDSTSAIVQPGDWGDGALWDTSVALFYNVYIPGSTVGGGKNNKVLEHIGGEVGGTGNVTLEVWIDQGIVWEKVFTSPIYVVGATSTATSTSELYTTDATTCIDVSPEIPIKRNENCFIRATRGTTGTEGTMKATVEHIY